MFRVINLGN